MNHARALQADDLAWSFSSLDIFVLAGVVYVSLIFRGEGC